MRKVFAAALVCGMLPVYGWGPEGHSLVARIAQEELTPAARARVSAILGPGVTMASISSWADQVRRDRSSTGPWHYIDIPIDKPHMDLARDCPKDDCVVAQIAAHRAILLDPAATEVQRLVHVADEVHDEHERLLALHSSDNKDKGGNDVHVVLFDRPGNLHGTWDSGLLRRMGEENDLFPSLLKDAEKHEKKWSKGTVADWAEESHKAAQKIVYGKLPKQSQATPAVIGSDYEKLADPLIRVQIEKAGDRLARYLNDTFR